MYLFDFFQLSYCFSLTSSTILNRNVESGQHKIRNEDLTLGSFDTLGCDDIFAVYTWKLYHREESPHTKNYSGDLAGFGADPFYYGFLVKFLDKISKDG